MVRPRKGNRPRRRRKRGANRNDANIASKKDVVKEAGTVTEALPNTLFRVRLKKNDEEVLAYLAGKMRIHRIRVLIGDTVEVEMDPYGGKGRIVRRS